MKKICTLILIGALLLSGCSNSEHPNGLDNYVEAKDGNSLSDAGQEEPQEIILDEIPKEYKNIEGNIFAVVKDGEIVSYKYGKKEGDKWTFVDCDEKGNIITKKVTTTKSETTTTSESTTTTTSSNSSSETATSSKANNSTTTKATTTQLRSVQTSAATTKQTQAQTPKPATQSSAKQTSKPATQSTTKATSAVPFSYTFINGLSGLPTAVKNYFQYYIDRADINVLLTKEKIGDNGSLYVMLYMLNGSPVTIRGVQSNGIISYHLGSGTSTVCRIIEIKGFNGKVSYNKV